MTVGSGQDLTRNASQVAAELIQQAILDGRLAPGQRLKEEQLAQDLGISRTPVREALLILQAQGIVLSSQNRGATVREYDVHDLEDLYRLRALLEGYAARQASLFITEEQIAGLEASCDRFEQLSPEIDVRAVVAENSVFHNMILEAAQSDRLRMMVQTVVELPLVYKSYIWYSPDQKRISEHHHRQIARAIAARDPERAELVMKEHVFGARDVLVARVQAEAGAGSGDVDGIAVGT